MKDDGPIQHIFETNPMTNRLTALEALKERLKDTLSEEELNNQLDKLTLEFKTRQEKFDLLNQNYENISKLKEVSGESSGQYRPINIKEIDEKSKHTVTVKEVLDVIFEDTTLSTEIKNERYIKMANCFQKNKIDYEGLVDKHKKLESETESKITTLKNEQDYKAWELEEKEALNRNPSFEAKELAKEWQKLVPAFSEENKYKLDEKKKAREFAKEHKSVFKKHFKELSRNQKNEMRGIEAPQNKKLHNPKAFEGSKASQEKLPLISILPKVLREKGIFDFFYKDPYSEYKESRKIASNVLSSFLVKKFQKMESEKKNWKKINYPFSKKNIEKEAKGEKELGVVKTYLGKKEYEIAPLNLVLKAHLEEVKKRKLKEEESRNENIAEINQTFSKLNLQNK